MAASCTLVCCGEETESDNAAIVRFSNGGVSNADNLDFSMYKNTDEKNPRKKSRRIMVAESDRLSYVGQNFGAGSLKCNSLCKRHTNRNDQLTLVNTMAEERVHCIVHCKITQTGSDWMESVLSTTHFKSFYHGYYVGVLNKQTMQMEVHNAVLFNMLPVIPGETSTATPQNTAQSYRDKVDLLIEAFGTNKQKRALASRRVNQVGSNALQNAVAKAATSVIDKKGLAALQQEVAETESQEALASHVPPCNPNADKREDVYPFDELLSPVELAALEEPGSKMAALTPAELQKMRDEGGSLSVVKHLENMAAVGEARERTACCAFYLSLLLKLVRQKNVQRK
ncbi:hypothetical protein ILYODFUR_028928, partial [Ilyodon furcidens]